MQLSKIVIPIEHIDGESHFAPVNIGKLYQLADQSLAEIHFAYVLGDFDRDFHLHERSVKETLLKQIQNHITGELDTMIARLKQQYPNCKFEKAILKGFPFIAANRYAVSVDADLMVLNPQAQKRDVFGFSGFTKHLMRKSALPIWAWRNSREKEIKRVAAAVDISPGDEVAKKLNRKIVDSAATMALALGASLSVIHVWRLFGKSHLLHSEMKTQSEVNEIAKQEIVARVALLQELVRENAPADIDADVRVIEGEVLRAIPEFVSNENIDLLVMGTVCRTGIPGLFIGNTAEALLDNVDCDVLTLKPEGFKSPLS